MKKNSRVRRWLAMILCMTLVLSSNVVSMAAEENGTEVQAVTEEPVIEETEPAAVDEAVPADITETEPTETPVTNRQQKNRTNRGIGNRKAKETKKNRNSYRAGKNGSSGKKKIKKNHKS